MRKLSRWWVNAVVGLMAAGSIAGCASNRAQGPRIGNGTYPDVPHQDAIGAPIDSIDPLIRDIPPAPLPPADPNNTVLPSEPPLPPQSRVSRLRPLFARRKSVPLPPQFHTDEERRATESGGRIPFDDPYAPSSGNVIGSSSTRRAPATLNVDDVANESDGVIAPARGEEGESGSRRMLDQTELEPNPFEPIERTSGNEGLGKTQDGDIETWPYHELPGGSRYFGGGGGREEVPQYPHAPISTPVRPIPRDQGDVNPSVEDAKPVVEQPALESPPSEPTSIEPGDSDPEEGVLRGIFPLPTIEPGPGLQRHRR